jgi:polyisoprenoid-binding protein YceI
MSETTTWKLDPAHSNAEFKVRHMMIAWVKGKFTGLSGALTLHESDHNYSGVEATIDVATIHTGAEDRDNHLKSADFFDAAQFPTISFKSTSVKTKGKGEFDVTGDLTMHGVTKPVTFAVEELSDPAKDPWGNLRVGIVATAKVNRKDFGLNWNAALETGGVLVGEDVTITLDVQFVKAA